MAKRSRRTVAASAAAAAGGVLAAGKVVHDLVADRNERKRSRRFRLEPDETPHQGIDRVARGQLGLAISLIEGHEGDGPGAIHDARKALKRERAVLRLCREWLGDERFRQENTILRDAGRSLSGARDAQVLIETLDGLPGTWSRFREELVAEARAFEEHDDEHDSRSNVVIALAGVRERVELWPLPDEGGPEGLASGLKRIYRKARDAGLEAAKHPNSENLHELRKRSKDVWYAAQLLGPISPKRVRKLRRRAHRLTDVLGQDHDLAVLLERAEATPASFGGGELKQLRALIARRRRGLRREALERAAKLYRRKPRKLLRRLGVASR